MRAGPEERRATTGEDLPAALAAFRAQVPLLASTIYLANCSQGPLAEPVRAALEGFLRTWSELGVHWDAWVEEVERARASFAAIIGAAPEDVAVGASVSQLTSSLASALVRAPELKGRPRVVTSGAEFPGVAHAWLATRALGWEPVVLEAGVETALAAQDFADAVDVRTAVVSFPHVCYANGALTDPAAVAAAAHDAGALAFLDAYQSVGTTPMDVGALGVDALAAGTLKYLLGTSGIAFLFVRPELRDRLEPTITGWFGRVDPFAFDPGTLDFPLTASRFDLGTPPVANAYAARAGIELVAAAGPDAVRAQVERLSVRAFELAAELGLRVLGPRSAASKGATTAVDAGSAERANEVQKDLRAQGVVVSARGRGLRLAPHGFTLLDELEHAMRAAAGLLGPGADPGSAPT